jgi:hypothetical protein
MKLSNGFWCQVARLREEAKRLEPNHGGERGEPLKQGTSLHVSPTEPKS